LNPISGDGGPATEHFHTAATALDRSIRGVKIHYGKRACAIGIKPINRGGHRVKGAHAYLPPVGKKAVDSGFPEQYLNGKWCSSSQMAPDNSLFLSRP
jgi:hypothetical protein